MMKIGKALRALTLACAVSVPLAVLAQPPDTGSVTVAPLGTAAPTIGAAMLGVLAVVLALGAFLVLRRRSSAMTAGFVAVVLSTTLAVMTYAAGDTIIVMGNDCTQQTRFEYNPTGDQRLRSACTAPIKIVDLEIQCDLEETPGEPLQDCVLDLILKPGDECRLETCDS